MNPNNLILKLTETSFYLLDLKIKIQLNLFALLIICSFFMQKVWWVIVIYNLNLITKIDKKNYPLLS